MWQSSDGSLAAYVAAREMHNDNIGVIMSNRVKPLSYFFGKLFTCGIVTIFLQFITSFPMFLYWSIKEHTFFDSVSTRYFVSSFFLYEVMLYLPFALFIVIISYCLNMMFTKWRMGLIFPTVYILIQFILPGTNYLPWIDFLDSPYTHFVNSYIEQRSPVGEYSRLIRVFSPIPFTSPSVILCIVIGLLLTVIAFLSAVITFNSRLGRSHFIKKARIENDAAV